MVGFGGGGVGGLGLFGGGGTVASSEEPEEEGGLDEEEAPPSSLEVPPLASLEELEEVLVADMLQNTDTQEGRKQRCKRNNRSETSYEQDSSVVSAF